MKLTAKQRELLEALSRVDETNLRGRFDKRTVRSLERRGLIAQRHVCPPGHDYGLTLHHITAAGKAALSEHTPINHSGMDTNI